jgi:hypothetical protein
MCFATLHRQDVHEPAQERKEISRYIQTVPYTKFTEALEEKEGNLGSANFNPSDCIRQPCTGKLPFPIFME